MEEYKQLFFEDFKVGDCFTSPSRTLHDGHFLFFAGLTGDNHPIHYDDEYARKTKFGSRVAHGLLLMAMTAFGASPLSHQLEDAMIAFAEQGCHFMKPAFIGDTIHPTFEVAGLDRREKAGILRLKIGILNQRGEKLIEGYHVYLLRYRPAGKSE
jgi:3-hydroxybutyryl-CoA dehydratase